MTGATGRVRGRPPGKKIEPEKEKGEKEKGSKEKDEKEKRTVR